MANAFGIIAALVLAAAAYFGFTNKKALEHQRAALSSEEQKLEINTEEFEEKKETLAGLQADTKEANEENATLTEQLETQLATNKALDVEIADKKSAVESKKSEVEQANEKLAGFGPLDDLERKLNKLGNDLATVKGELLLKDTEIQTRTALSNSLGTENEAIASVLEKYAKKQSLDTLDARVSRVVTDLGFVILSGGDNAGIVRDSILDVKRNGSTIGKLKVTGTETSTAAANIIPDSFEEGMTVRVGDTVVASSK